MVRLHDISATASDTSGSKDSSDASTDVRILLLGDPGVGKTSILYSLVNDEFTEEQLPPRIGDVNVTLKLTPTEACINITDYSQRDSMQEDLTIAIQKATVICIVYISGSHNSLDRVAKYWIPTVRAVHDEYGEHKPMILVANKIDLRGNTNLSNKLDHIRRKFLHIENFTEVSAINHTNVVEIVSLAQEAITYPTMPLFDARTRTLTAKCRVALTAIFKLCDHDGDSLMSDHEINMFQESCFGTPLKQDALEDLKNIIRQSTIDGIANNSLTLDGFLFLHALSIDKGRQDFTWQVLRKYNYDNQLNLETQPPVPANETTSSSESVVNATDATVDNAAADDDDDQDSLSGLVEETQNHLKIDPRSKIRGRELISQLDIAPWLRDNPRMVKTGLGLTVTTFISFMALKFLIQGISKG